MQGTGLAAARSLPAGCSSRSSPGTGGRHAGLATRGWGDSGRSPPAAGSQAGFVAPSSGDAGGCRRRPGFRARGRGGRPGAAPGSRGAAAPRPATPRATLHPMPVLLPWGAAPCALCPTPSESPVGSYTPCLAAVPKGPPPAGHGERRAFGGWVFWGCGCVFLSRGSQRPLKYLGIVLIIKEEAELKRDFV